MAFRHLDDERLPTWSLARSQLLERYAELPDDWDRLNMTTEQLLQRNLVEFYDGEKNGPIGGFAKFVRNCLWAHWFASVVSISDLILWEESEGFRFQSTFRGLKAHRYLELIGLFARGYIACQRRRSDGMTAIWFTAISKVFDLKNGSNDHWIEICDLASDASRFASRLIVQIETEVDELLGFVPPPWARVLDAPTVDAMVRAGITNKWVGVFYVVNEATVRLSGQENHELIDQLFGRVAP